MWLERPLRSDYACEPTRINASGGNADMAPLSRRNILFNGAAGGLVAAVAAGDASAQTYSAAAGSDPGPHDDAQAAVNPYDWQGLPTDHGNLGTLRSSFSTVHNRHTPAGWAREVIVRNFPISKAMAGVNMRPPTGAFNASHTRGVPCATSRSIFANGRPVDPCATNRLCDSWPPQ